VKRYYENSQADLIKSSKSLVVTIYSVINSFSLIDEMNLGQQMKRSAVSIPSNIVECEQGLNDMKTITHLNFAYVSLRELSAYLDVAKKLEYISEKMFSELVKKIDQLIDSVGASCSVACIE